MPVTTRVRKHAGPVVCTGDDGSLSTGPPSLTGSAPRVRGRMRRIDPPAGLERTSPACAGTTPRLTRACRSAWDQPRVSGDDRRAACPPGPVAGPVRMRGDDRRPDGTPIFYTGPAPHARGRPNERTWHHNRCRTSPACAGTTRPSPARQASRADQPRMRGDDRLLLNPLRRSLGPAPHARGRRPRTP
jgi:hypothetical protein